MRSGAAIGHQGFSCQPETCYLNFMPTDADADETLMLRYREGDADAFTRLYARHKGPLYRYLLRQCGQPAVAEELFQDIWLKLIAARAGYTVQARFTTYLYRLAHNRLVDHYRASARGLPLSYADDCPEWAEVPAPEQLQPEMQDDRRRQSERLLALLAELPEAQREAVLLKEEAGLSLEAIAQATGTGRETVKSRLRYALAHLRRGMRGAP
ncbi:MAG TPA: RNA polymerase sigma factor [Candidatus Competibacteraceae bacterium]|nr:RNA polymerase sigma factor [Candidatus Competibacteraceae bacterium]HQA26275.1 RNA polymerase sigma factor [Candidatus Competibacteraceae bacterium]HQD57737.1 RNA polymerase sigma factor [Candidatus Competibacteraceae bacterium]